METNNENAGEIAEQLITLESEVKGFADGLPYWAKFLAEKILLGLPISDQEINLAYSYLLEELKLNPETAKPEIVINYNGANSGNYKLDLLFTKLENIEGVNALLENQTIEFSPNVTIIYGVNGSGKSGYVRLLKKAFYSKAPEDIIKNIHIETGHKPINAKFTFQSAGKTIALNYPENSTNTEFEQYAVFDGKSVLRHLEQKNEFEFRPAGLGFFGEFTEAIKSVETKLNADITSKQSENIYADLFEGESEIKTIIDTLSDKTKIDDLKKYTPFSEEDKTQKTELEKQYDELLLASKSKEKEIKTLESITQLIKTNKQSIEALNKHFSDTNIKQVQTYITDCINKEAIAKAEGIENFKTDKIENIGTSEWKNFIVAAEQFAKKQKKENVVYPENNDTCLLCQQPLSVDAQQLIINYWAYIKSVAEQEAKNAAIQLDKLKSELDKLNFNLFPADTTLTAWLTEKYPKVLSSLQEILLTQKALSANIIADITAKTINKRNEIKVGVSDHDTIIEAINASIKLLRDNQQSTELDKLLKAKTSLIHKEKLGLHFAKIETHINNQVWIKNAGKANFWKRKITDTEKSLSDKYFNQKYIDTFNQECTTLNGSFGIEISYTGSGGKSYRQLKLKGNSPHVILSEGEQKVIAIADFLAEMQLSEVNRGILFDDPVNSLDNDRKKQIAERLIIEAKKKQTIIFTHDLVFFYHLKNYSKKYLRGIDNCFLHHSVEKESNLISGKVLLNNTPANEGQYNEPTKAEEWLNKSKQAAGNEKTDFAKAGLSSLRASYEALAIFTIMNGVVQRFDPQIRMGRLKEIKFDQALINTVVEKHGDISDLIEAHLQSDEFGLTATPEILEQHIKDFKEIKGKIKDIKYN